MRAKKYVLIKPALSAEKPKSIMRRIASGTAKVAAAATVTANSDAAMRGCSAKIGRELQKRAREGFFSAPAEFAAGMCYRSSWCDYSKIFARECEIFFLLGVCVPFIAMRQAKGNLNYS